MNLNEIITGTVRDPFNGKLYEGLIRSVDFDTAINLLNKNLKDVPDFQIINTNEERGIISFNFKVNYPDLTMSRIYGANIPDPNISKILVLVNNLGYFVASYIFDFNPFSFYKSKYSPNKFRDDFFSRTPREIVFTIEKKYDDVDEDIPNKIYHITNKSFINKIQNKGLIPVSGSKQSYHPERIYFTKSIDDMKKFSNMVSKFIPKEDQLILTIDTTDLNTTFYKDPNLLGAVYTYKNINPKNIISYEIND